MNYIHKDIYVCEGGYKLFKKKLFIAKVIKTDWKIQIISIMTS